MAFFIKLGDGFHCITAMGTETGLGWQRLTASLAEAWAAHRQMVTTPAGAISRAAWPGFLYTYQTTVQVARKEVTAVALTNHSPDQTRKQVARLAIFALAAVTYFTAVIVALHFLRPDRNPIAEPTSTYAVGRYGYLMTSAFISMSLASLALAIGLYRGVPEPARSRIGLGFLGIWVVALLVAATFPIDVDGAPTTVAGTIHATNGRIAFFSATLATIFISRRFSQDERWRPLHRLAVTLSLIMLAEFAVFIAFIVSGSGYPGLGQRIFLATFVAWFALTAAHLRSISTGSKA
jgi:hypothetical protein